MKASYLILPICAALLFYQCTQNTKQLDKVDDVKPIGNTSCCKTTDPVNEDIPSFETSLPFKPDTKELKRKRQLVLKKFEETIYYNIPDYDTLVDINYDGYRDYLLGGYGAAGTGLKYRIYAYVFSPKKNNYIIDHLISDQVNPSFFLNEHKITGFYIGGGGGGGNKLEWIKGKWVVTKTFEVDNQGDTTVWIINYPLKKKTEKITRPFQMVPPDEILEMNDYL